MESFQLFGDCRVTHSGLRTSRLPRTYSLAYISLLRRPVKRCKMALISSQFLWTGTSPSFRPLGVREFPNASSTCFKIIPGGDISCTSLGSEPEPTETPEIRVRIRASEALEAQANSSDGLMVQYIKACHASQEALINSSHLSPSTKLQLSRIERISTSSPQKQQYTHINIH
jgi:hypothetical protein